MFLLEKSNLTSPWGSAKTSTIEINRGHLFLSPPRRKVKLIMLHINTISDHCLVDISVRKAQDTAPEKSPELSIGPGNRLCSPTLYISQLSKPTYFFHCLNHRLSIRYLETDKNLLYQKSWGSKFLQQLP